MKSLQILWRSGNRRWNLRLPDLQRSCINHMTGARLVAPAMSTRRRAPLFTYHDDVIKWKLFPRYWQFARGIHRFPVNSPHKGKWHGALIFSLRLNKQLRKQSRGWWFETLSCAWWRHCNVVEWSDVSYIPLHTVCVSWQVYPIECDS